LNIYVQSLSLQDEYRGMNHSGVFHKYIEERNTW